MSRGLCILIVEDDPDTREALQAVLELEGYEVIVAEHGQEALDRIRDVTPDVILLDMRMPIMDGGTFARTYRQQPGPLAPIIALTAAADAADVATRIGAAACVPKPFGVQDLLRTIERCLG